MSLNVDVEMVNFNTNRDRLPESCEILIAEIQIQEFQETVLKCCAMFTEKQSIEHVIREHYFSVNNACSLNFESIRIKRVSYTAYGYCKDPSCNFFKFQGSYNGNIKIYSNRIELKHSINAQK